MPDLVQDEVRHLKIGCVASYYVVGFFFAADDFLFFSFQSPVLFYALLFAGCPA
jgi:hypothetical protein